MKKVLRIFRNIIFGIFFVVYLSVIICASTLVLNRNDYGYTEFGNKALIDVKENTDKYLKGQLVVVEKRIIDNLKVGDEVFVYQTNQQEKTVKVVASPIKAINSEEATPYITISADDTSWGQDYIAGQSIKVYDSIGSILTFVESKWIFFAIFIVPCFFILLYEIYSVIIVIKFDGDEVVVEGGSTTGTSADEAKVDNINVVMDQNNANNMNDLMAQLNSLKAQLNQNNANGVGTDMKPDLQQIQPDVQPQVNAQVETPQQVSVQPQVDVQTQSQPQVDVQAQSQPQVQPQQPQVSVQPQVQPQVQTQVQPQVQAQPQIQTQEQPKVDVQPQVQPQIEPQIQQTVDQPAMIDANVSTDTSNSNIEMPTITEVIPVDDNSNSQPSITPVDNQTNNT